MNTLWTWTRVGVLWVTWWHVPAAAKLAGVVFLLAFKVPVQHLHEVILLSGQMFLAVGLLVGSVLTGLLDEYNEYRIMLLAALLYAPALWDRTEECRQHPVVWEWIRQPESWLSRLLRYPFAGFIIEHSPGLVSEPVIYACRPHGILVFSSWLTFFNGMCDRPGRRVLVAAHSKCFWIPGFRELLLGAGGISVGRDSISRALQLGYSVAVIQDGKKGAGPPLIPLPDPPRICTFARDHAIPLYAVEFGGEEEICWVWHGEWDCVRTARAWMYRHFGFFGPFLLFFPRVWAWSALVLRTRINPGGCVSVVPAINGKH